MSVVWGRAEVRSWHGAKQIPCFHWASVSTTTRLVAWPAERPMAYELLLQAGQSRCDVVRMARQHIRKGVMTMGRQKTGVPFNIDIMPRLQAAMDAMPASNNLTFLVTAQAICSRRRASATGSETCAERRRCRSDAPRAGCARRRLRT